MQTCTDDNFKKLQWSIPISFIFPTWLQLKTLRAQWAFCENRSNFIEHIFLD